MSEGEVREMMDRTSKKLGALDRRKLTAGKQVDFDTARRFLSQAEEAVKAKNLLLAQYAADKAETLVNGLR
jgi:predicted translin family RNA/ssDNA-binding protein